MQRKILLLMLGGIALGLSGSPKGYFRVLRAIKREWGLDKKRLNDAIRLLYKSKLVSEKMNKDGTLTLVLTGKGKEIALTYDIEKMEIKKPLRWDKKWRIVIFDVPEPLKKKRDALRHRLKKLGFFKLQKSVFVHPFDCFGEIEYIIEFYQIRRYVRFIIATSIDNELHLKNKFQLL